MHRLDRVRERLRESEADAALLTFLPDVRWACGFSGTNGTLLVRPDAAHFLTDGRYDEQARQEVDGAEVHVYRGTRRAYLKENDLLGDPESVLVQSDHLTVSELESLRTHFEDVSWTPVSQFVTRAVASKDEREVAAIRAAQEITESVFRHVVDDVLRPGLSEREVAAEIVYQHLRRGAEKMSFDPIVASGPNGARPHARPTDRVLQRGDLVVIDMGCFRDGYASDMTRTVALGEPGEAARTGYALVLEAQKAALDAARSGIEGKALDAVARDVIKEGGREDAFAHGLGHGLGLQIHEWPRVSYTVEYDLPKGACVTIEPGIYVPEEGFGVRIEDVVQLHPEGCTNLTSAEKDLIVL